METLLSAAPYSQCIYLLLHFDIHLDASELPDETDVN